MENYVIFGDVNGPQRVSMSISVSRDISVSIDIYVSLGLLSICRDVNDLSMYGPVCYGRVDM